MLKKERTNKQADEETLYGLLSSYKLYNTYFRILICREKDSLVLQVTDNPKKWTSITKERYEDYIMLKRSEIGIDKLSVKFLSPTHLIKQLGPTFGIKLPSDQSIILDNYKKEGYILIETKSKFLAEVIQGIQKIINLSPQ